MERLLIWRGLDEWRAETAGDRPPPRRDLDGRRPPAARAVNYASGDFTADIHFDEDGLVELYEDYLERLS